MNETGGSKSTDPRSVAGLWIAACSLALALLRTVFDVMAGAVSRCSRRETLGESALLVGADRFDQRGHPFEPVDVDRPGI